MAPITSPLRALAFAALGFPILAAPAWQLVLDEPAVWPQWRGPAGQGVANDDRLPIAWSTDRNVLWKTPIEGRGYSSPAVWHKHVFLTTSFEGAVVPGAAQVVWERDRGTAYTPSAIANGDYAYLLTDGGLVTCINIRTGEMKYEGGRPTKPARVWSSLVAYRDRLFLSNEDGDTYVLRAGPAFEIERVNSLDGPIYASLAPAGGRVYIRTTWHLYAIAEP